MQVQNFPEFLVLKNLITLIMFFCAMLVLVLLSLGIVDLLINLLIVMVSNDVRYMDARNLIC